MTTLTQAPVMKARDTKAREVLTPDERAVLRRLRGLGDASQEAEHAHGLRMLDPRGAYLRGRTLVVYGRDGFSTDIRAERTVVRVALLIEAMGQEIAGFGVGGGGGTWAVTVSIRLGTAKRERECLVWEFSDIVSRAWEGVGGYECRTENNRRSHLNE